MRLLPVAILCLSWLGASLRAEPVISEFVAKNNQGIVDEDGQHGDWVEIHNPTSIPQSMEGWYLTDDATRKTKWKFPAVSIAPGGFLLVWADGKDRRSPAAPLHANFSLDADGEYLALVRPDGVTVQQGFAPAFPPQQSDRAYGIVFDRTVLVGEGANADFRVPTEAAQIPANWKTAATSPVGWTLKQPVGLGFGFEVPGMLITVRAKNPQNGALDDQAAALALLEKPSGHADIASESVSVLPTFNVLGEGGDGHYDGNATLPAGVTDDYVYRGTGSVEIPSDGAWTFGLNSDDGGRIIIDGNVIMDDPTFHGAEDHLATVTLTAGRHTFEVWYWERGGGDEGEFYAAPGTFSAWDPSMVLVGDTAKGGLACFTPAVGEASGGAVKTNVRPVMLGVNASLFARVPFTSSVSGYTSLNLLMRYNDGFSAWLNGTQLATANAPEALVWNSEAAASRAAVDSLTVAAFNITSKLSALKQGVNVLALQGLNTSANDGTFLLEPQIVAGKLATPRVYAFFDQPTPGAINGAVTSFGKVQAVQYSPRRGVIPNAVVTKVPFALTLTSTTPGVSIRYTTNGIPPTPTFGDLYTGPISITKTSTIQAIAYRTGWEDSPVTTSTYIVPADVVTQSPAGQSPGRGWPLRDENGYFNGQRLDYGMDPEIVSSTDESIGGKAQVISALRALPSVSIVAELGDLFDPVRGIYVNAGQRGLAAERPCSIEWLGDPVGDFQTPAGIRIRGGYSRSGDNPKHGFHIHFRSSYGNSELRFPLFANSPVDSFAQIDLRTSENYAWSFGGDSNNTFLREEFCRQTQLDLGSVGSHPRYIHLYINGHYWGIYDTDERTEADHCSRYIGGKKENWDVVKAEPGDGYITGVTDGNADAWNLLFSKANPLTAPGVYTRRTLTAADYYDMMGLGPDGVTPNGSPVLLDVDNLIDYMLVTFWTGNLDGATSAFLGDEYANNWFGARDRTGKRGFVFFVHDSEHTLFNVDEDRTGPFNLTIADLGSYDTKRTRYNPMFLHADLCDVPEYKKRWHDRVQRHLFNGGALSLSSNRDRLNRLAATVESAIIAESARWGDEAVDPPRNRRDWEGARDYILNDYFPNRTERVVRQLRDDGLYSTVDGVTISPPGGVINVGASVSMTGPETGTIYYTINGADPMRPDGSVDPTAQVFAASAEVRDPLVASGSTWKYRSPSTDLGSSSIVAEAPEWSTANWKHPGFDDTGTEWQAGPAELGSGDGDEATVIDIGSDGSRYPVIYFRGKFTVENPSQYSALELDVKRDDGAIVYVNGHEVGRSNMPGGAIGYDYSGLGADDETSFLPITDTRLQPNVLIAGENTIAVEVHQVSAGSSDTSFDLRLRGVRPASQNALQIPTGVAVLKARAKAGAEWSALSAVTFYSETEVASAANLVVSEVNYHPETASSTEVTAGYDREEGFEYVELMNVGTKGVDLMGVKFDTGVSWTFDGTATAPRLLAPGARVRLVGNPAAYALRYGAGHVVAGSFAGSLTNSGETLVLRAASGEVIRSFTYSDVAPWPLEPDGTGAVLALRSPLSVPDHNVAANWMAKYGERTSVVIRPDVLPVCSHRVNILNVLGNDSAAAGKPLTVTAVTAATHGTVTLNGGVISYTPGSDFLSGDSFSYTADDGAGGTGTATVTLTNPVAVRVGTYSSAVLDRGVPIGSVRATVTVGSAVSGAVIFGGKSYAFKGRVTPSATVSFRIKRPGLSDLVVALNIFTLGGFAQTSGTVTEGAQVYTIESERQFATKRPVVVKPGAYPVSLTGGPGGVGTGILRVGTAAVVSFAGRLGDGASLSFGSGLRVDGSFVVRRPLYVAPMGYLYGDVAFAAEAGSSARGRLAWKKPAQTKPGTQLFPGGFEASVDLLASSYAAKPNTSTLTYSNGHASVTLDLPLSHRVGVGANDVVAVETPGADGLTVKISRAGGTISGSFIDPVSQKRGTISGVILQQENRGVGYYLLPGRIGKFELIPE